MFCASSVRSEEQVVYRFDGVQFPTSKTSLNAASPHPSPGLSTYALKLYKDRLHINIFKENFDAETPVNEKLKKHEKQDITLTSFLDQPAS